MKQGLDINCECHGQGVSSVVCGHLVNSKGAPLGFIENSDEPDDLQGWCYACEYLFQKENEITEAFKSFNRMALVCHKCYAEIKATHSVSI